MINPKRIRQGILLTVGLGALVKTVVDKELNKVVKKGHITKSKKLQVTKRVVKKAIVEGRKMETFVRNEAIRELKLAIAELEKTAPKKKKAVKKKVTKKKKVVKKKKVAKKRVVKRKVTKKKAKKKVAKKRVVKKKTTKKRKR